MLPGSSNSGCSVEIGVRFALRQNNQGLDRQLVRRTICTGDTIACVVTGRETREHFVRRRVELLIVHDQRKNVLAQRQVHRNCFSEDTSTSARYQA
jgi:hypothetical protein